MSDIRCVVCGEPWDAYGVNHGDMLAWEAKLFRAGAGCPSCKGELPEQPFEPESIFDLENGDGDEMKRLLAWENREARPAWAAPEPTVLWTCDGCGVEVVRDESECSLDGTKLTGDPLQYRVPSKSRARHWYSSHPFHSEVPEAETPAFVFEGDVKVCEFCLVRCHGCGCELSHTVEFGDTYAHGNAFYEEGDYSGDRYHCSDCYEALPSPDDESEDEDEPEPEESDDDTDNP